MPTTKLSRRTVLKGGAAGLVAFMSGCAVNTAPGPLIGFRPVPRAAATGDAVVVSDDYDYQVLIPWGEPLTPSGPAYSWPPGANQSAQVGIGHDGMHFFPVDDRGDRGVLAMNNEYGSNIHVFGRERPADAADVRASQEAHGVTLVELEKKGGEWKTAESRNARRIHLGTEVTFGGPVAGHPLIQNRAGNPYAGTLNNCANGATPWGTYLTCEENFNFYFGALGDYSPTATQQRYGFIPTGVGYDWHRYDPRFDLSNPDYAGEQHRFGWVVEIDPTDPDALPVKRSAMGRFKHEGAALVEGGDGRIVAYMGDDQRFEFIYRFVSSGDWREMRAAGRSPLDEGVLYVARFDEGGRGEWLPLTLDNPKLAGQFEDQATLLVHTRLAATLAGATPMDRPEWTTVAPSGDVYCTLTNNTRREVADAANPFAPNPNGMVIRWRDDDNHLGRYFSWDHFLLSNDYLEGEDSFASPDGLMADPDGRLFICTDGQQHDGMPNQLLVADTRTGELSRLLTGVTGCEITGLTMTPDRRTLFVNVQHPGNGDPTVTNFPAAADGVTVPRDSTLAIRRRDGGIVGS